MKEFIIYLFHFTICLSAFFIVYFCLLRGTTFFRFNRFFLLLGLVVSFIIPLIQISYDVVIPFSANTPVVDELENNILRHTEFKFDIWHLLFIIYIFGVIMILLKKLNASIKLVRLRREAKVTSVEGKRLVYNTDIITPFSFFNTIYINKNKLQAEEERIILQHELNHIKQRHWIDLLCSECALMLQWFNPLIWYYIYLMKENHEYLADEAVLRNGESIAIYQAVLINQRFQGPIFSFTNSFNYSNHKKRLTMMKKVKTSPWRKLVVISILPLLGTFIMLNARPNYIYDQSGTKEENRRDTLTIKVATGEEKSSFYIKDDIKAAWLEKVFQFEDVGSVPVKVILQMLEDSSKPPLYIVDDVEVTSIDHLNPDDIKDISVWKGKEAVEKYGNKAKYGIIIIKLK